MGSGGLNTTLLVCIKSIAASMRPPWISWPRRWAAILRGLTPTFGPIWSIMRLLGLVIRCAGTRKPALSILSTTVTMLTALIRPQPPRSIRDTWALASTESLRTPGQSFFSSSASSLYCCLLATSWCCLLGNESLSDGNFSRSTTPDSKIYTTQTVLVFLPYSCTCNIFAKVLN